MHNNTLILPVTWCFESKTWSDFNEILLEPFQVLHKIVKFWCILVYFSKISEKTRPNVALMIKFVEF